MITENNIKEVLSSLQEEDVYQAMDSDLDYVAVRVHIYNTGYKATIEPMDYSDEVLEVIRSGNILIDKDEFLRLYVESGAYNVTIEEYI